MKSDLQFIGNDKPNIIYILGDDHRAEIMGNMGHPIVKTPNLDNLAREGVLFQNAFCTSPICTPSRTCHYLGQWERKHGINFNSESSLDPKAWENSFPMQLKKQGYFVGWVGKNHVPAGYGGYESGYFEKVFDYWYGNHGHSYFYPKERKGGEIYRNAKSDTQIEIFEEGALNFLNPQKDFIENCISPLTYRPEDKPFCLCITFNLPHTASTGSMEMRETDDELYRTVYRNQINEMPVPKTYIAHDDIVTPRLPKYVYSGKRLRSYDYVNTVDALKERMVRICQTVTGMDRMIGRLREELERLGLADNTIIIFSTDHGIHHGEHGLGGKCFLYEEDIRIPMIIYDPRLPKDKKGQVRQEFALVPDLAPTVLDLVGVEIPNSMQGKSLLPLILGETNEWRDEFFAEQLNDNQCYPRSESVRNREWKYIRYFKRTDDYTKQNGCGTYGTKENYAECLTSTLNGEQPIYEELYYLKEDPYEEHNLASDSSYKDVLDMMRDRIITLGWEAKGGEGGPLTLPYKRRK